MALTKAHNRMVAGSRINVLDFGATGDGTTDDTAAIQAAIDEAYASSGFDNKSVFLPTPAVAYKVTGTLNVYQRVALIGEDKWNCRILGSGQILVLEQPRLVSNIWFDGGSIQNGTNKIHEAAWTGADRANTAIILGPKDLSYQGGHAIIEQCRFSNWGVAIEGPSSINAHIQDCYFQAGYHDVYFRATNTALQFASTIKETKNYHAGAEGVGLGFYPNANGYQICDVSNSVYELLCKSEPGLGFIDTSSIAVRALGGDHVYFETDGATYTSAKAVRSAIFSGKNCYFQGFNEVFKTATTSNFWTLENSEITSSTSTYDMDVSAVNGRNFFRNVGFDNGLNPAALGNTTLMDCSNSGVLPSALSNHYMSGQFKASRTSDAIIANTTAATPQRTLEVQQQNTAVGGLGADASRLVVASDNALLLTQNLTTPRSLLFANDVFRPTQDDVLALGGASYLWTEVFAAAGTINTSDERQKQDIEALSDAEQRVASALKGLVKKFRFKSAVEKKGDDARIHVGVIAQEVQAAFETEGLDAHRYGILCYDEWDAEIDEDGNEIMAAGNRYGVRYSELLAFIISAL